MSEIQFGRKYHDVITGFEGVAIGFTEYLSGCNQVLLAPQVGDDGAKKESHWFDIQRIKTAGDATLITLDNSGIPQRQPRVLLGKKYREKFTMFEGIAVGRAEYIAGTIDVLIVPKVGSDGERRESVWFPEIHLDELSDNAAVMDNEKNPGCDLAAPKR